MKKRTKIGLIALIALIAISFILIKKSSTINVTLVGVIQKTKSMSQVLLICDSRTFKEADFVCSEANQSNDDEINNLCNLRLDTSMTNFNNKCMRYFKLVDRVRQSQDKLSEFLKKNPHDQLINESFNPESIKGHSDILKECTDPINRPDCMLETSAFFIDGWFKEKHVDYLFDDLKLNTFIKAQPNFEEDIAICKDYQTKEKCQIKDEFINIHQDAIFNFLSSASGKNIIVIMKQEHLNYITCNSFDKVRYNCKEIEL